MTAASPVLANSNSFDFLMDRDNSAVSLMASCKLIRHIAMRDAPEGAWLTGAQFRCVSGEIDLNSIWLSCVTADHKALNMRPNVFDGWRDCKGWGPA